MSKASSNFAHEEYRQRLRLKRRGVSPTPPYGVLVVVVLYWALSQRWSVSPALVDMATKITADSESRTPVSYTWSIVTFSLSRAIIELFAIFCIMGFHILGPKIVGFCPPKWSSQVSTRPTKRHFLAWDHVFWNTKRGGLARRVTCAWEESR